MDTFTTLETILLYLQEELKAGNKVDNWDKKCFYGAVQGS